MKKFIIFCLLLLVFVPANARSQVIKGILKAGEKVIRPYNLPMRTFEKTLPFPVGTMSMNQKLNPKQRVLPISITSSILLKNHSAYGALVTNEYLHEELDTICDSLHSEQTETYPVMSDFNAYDERDKSDDLSDCNDVKYTYSHPQKEENPYPIAIGIVSAIIIAYIVYRLLRSRRKA